MSLIGEVGPEFCGLFKIQIIHLYLLQLHLISLAHICDMNLFLYNLHRILAHIPYVLISQLCDFLLGWLCLIGIFLWIHI